MGKLIGWGLVVLAFCTTASFVEHSVGVFPGLITKIGAAVGTFFVATALLATTNRGHVAAFATAVATAVLALNALEFSVSTAGVMVAGELALTVLFIAVLATVTASQLRVKYWLALVSMLAEGAAIFAFC